MKQLFNYVSFYHKTFVPFPLNVLDSFSTFLKLLLWIKLLTKSCLYPFHIITRQKLKQTKWPISNLIKLDVVKETQLELELKEKSRQ